jgi:hypothetical protein
MFGYGGILVILLSLFIWLVFFHGFTKIDDYVLSRYFPKKRKFTFGDNGDEDFEEPDGFEHESKSPTLTDKIFDKIKPNQKAEFPTTNNDKEIVFEPVSYTPMSQSKQIINYVDNIFKNVKFTDRIVNKRRVSEETWNNPNLNFSWNSNIEFYGYYQSSKNFFGYDEYVKEMFGPDNNFITKLKSLYPNFKNQDRTH